MSASTGIDTASVSDRRGLRFETVEDLRADIERLVAAEQAGTLRRTGNWTAGQTFGHLAAWIEFAYEGYPMRLPWFVRFFIKRKLPQYLREGLNAGVRIPRVAGGTYGTEPLEVEDGARRLWAALERLESERARFPSPAFGAMSHADQITLNLRHAELHLSFLHPQ